MMEGTATQSPPLSISHEEIDLFITRFRKSVEEVLGRGAAEQLHAVAAGTGG